MRRLKVDNGEPRTFTLEQLLEPVRNGVVEGCDALLLPVHCRTASMHREWWLGWKRIDTSSALERHFPSRWPIK